MNNAPQWRTIGRSVQGAAHKRVGLPNQDAIRWYPDSGSGPPLILAVSDGHGSAKCFRSNVGSRLATEAATQLIQDLLAGQPDPTNLTAIKRTAEERLPQELVRRWRDAVEAHLKASPLSEEELSTLEAKRDAKTRQQVADNPILAYGATILSALVTQASILYLQLGDGDILTVMENGDVTRPLPHDARLFANETTSLCMPDAWREVRFRFQAIYGPQPALILLATDGYANSFVNEEAFLKVGSDILDILRSEGLKPVKENLDTWLREASEAGSGDDITLGIIYRNDVLNSLKKAGHMAEAPPAQPQTEPEPAATTTPSPPSEETPVTRRPPIHKENGVEEPVKPWFELLADESTR